jgi:hypothetical protein
MQKFSARIWFERRTRCAQPSRASILTMLAQLEGELRGAGATPVGLAVTTFAPGTFVGAPSEKYLAVIAITAKPGELKRSLACWYEWQHPHWRFAAPADEALLLPAAVAAGESGPGQARGESARGGQRTGPLDLSAAGDAERGAS